MKAKGAGQGKAFDMAAWAENCGPVESLLRWPHLSLPHSSEDGAGKHWKTRVTFVPSPPSPDTDTWQVWAHLWLSSALEPD